MAEEDMTEKALETYDDVFADIVNNLVFQGRQRVKEEDLEQGRERSVYSGEKALREQERDVSKYWRKKNIRIALLGIENETQPEDDMPFRVIGYDGASYRDQIHYDVDASGKRKKTFTRYPVITLVLYFGYKRHWDKAKTLYEVIGERLDDELKPLVSDYKINLYEIAYITDEQLAGFKSDFRFVADYFVQKRKNGTYVGSHEKVKHIREVLQLLAVLANDRRFSEIERSFEEGGEPGTMCEVLDEIEQRGIKKGEKIGEERGEKVGIKKGEERLAKLGQLLLAAGRTDDLAKALNTAAARKRLYKEFGI